MTVSNRRGWIMIMIGVLKMNRSDIDYIIEKLDSYKPDNIYDGYNSVKEKQDQRVAEVLDSIIEEIKSDYENRQTPSVKGAITIIFPNNFDINNAEKTFVKFKNGNVCRLLSMIQVDTDGKNPVFMAPILEHIASGKTDLELTDLKGVVKMMVGETNDTQRSN